MKYINKQIENSLISNLSNIIAEFKLDRLTEQDIYNFFKHILIDANVDSEIVLNVLEDVRFGQLGKEEARNIKVDEGW